MWHSSELWLTLLIIHGLAAFLLLGALTHQTISVWVPIHVHVSSFFDRARAVSARNYGAAIIVLYIATFLLGCIVYPDYKMTASNVLTSQHWIKANWGFEYKEHVLAFGLALLPAYWYYWKPPLIGERDFVRAMLTTILTVISWIGFLVGHVLNNIAGLGGA
ncbi:MAG TPA: hypothetical protein VKX28_05130 [Xanthobacteraceae bacterium]|nr:hypothetical protein [Xanthobacteraceae bacterium]